MSTSYAQQESGLASRSTPNKFGEISPIGVVVRWWVLLLLAAIVGGLVGWWFLENRTPAYEAQVRLLVGPLSNDPDQLEGLTDLARTYGEIAESDLVVEEVAQLAGLAPGNLTVTAKAESNAPIVVLTLIHGDRTMTQELLSALVEELASFVGAEVVSLDQRRASNGTELTMLDTTVTPDSLVLPSVAGAVLGATVLVLLSGALAIAFEIRFDPESSASSAPVLGSISVPFGFRSGDLEIADGGRPVQQAEKLARSLSTTFEDAFDAVPLLVVLLTTFDRRSTRAMFQLIAAFKCPVAVLDPVDEDRGEWEHLRSTGAVRAGNRVIAGYVTADALTLTRRRGSQSELSDGLSLTVAHISNDVDPHFLEECLDISSAVVVLGKLPFSRRRNAQLQRLLAAAEDYGTPLLGVIPVKRRFLRGSSSSVERIILEVDAGDKSRVGVNS